MTDVKNRLNQLRMNKGVSLSKMSRELKEKHDISVSPSQLNYYEKGIRSPRNNVIWEKIADYFGVPVGYLLGYDVQILELEAKKKNFEALDSLEKSIKGAFEATNSVVEIRIQGISDLLKKLTSGIVNDEYDKETVLEILKNLEELTKGFESDISDMMELQAKYSATEIHKNRLQNNIDKTIKKISN
ncbi:TPA: helix-turn-helix domain-containing protein [Streptococcus suis]